MVAQRASCLIILHVWHQNPRAENGTAITSCKWRQKDPLHNVNLHTPPTALRTPDVQVS